MTQPAHLEALLRHLHLFRSIHETDGITSLTGPAGEIWCLADLERLAVISSFMPVCQAAAVAALCDDKPVSSRCLEPALDALCTVYDSASFWRREAPGGFRRLFSSCTGCALAAA